MYAQFYGLKEDPFRLTPDPKFLYLAETHCAAFATLMQGIMTRKGIMILSGPIGTGKTTLIHTVLQFLASRSVGTCSTATALLLNPTLTREELLEAILDEFEVPCESPSKPRRISALHQMLLETQRRGGTAVLFVDEAHLLTVELLEEIRLLNNVDSYHEKLLQIILCGQSELSALLRRPELRAFQQRVASTCTLRPLSLPETRTYVTDRLHAAGMRGPTPFPGTVLEEVFLYSQGVPRTINLLCDGCLTIGFATRRNQIGLDIVEEAAFSLGLERTVPTQRPTPIPTAMPEAPRDNRKSVDILIEAMRSRRATARE